MTIDNTEDEEVQGADPYTDALAEKLLSEFFRCEECHLLVVEEPVTCVVKTVQQTVGGNVWVNMPIRMCKTCRAGVNL